MPQAFTLSANKRLRRREKMVTIDDDLWFLIGLHLKNAAADLSACAQDFQRTPETIGARMPISQLSATDLAPCGYKQAAAPHPLAALTQGVRIHLLEPGKSSRHRTRPGSGAENQDVRQTRMAR